MAKDRKENKVMLEGELGQLRENVKSLEQTLNKERSIYHYNLAVSFTQAELYDDAIEAYEKSLKFNPDNADAYYNLGLLYANIRNNPEKAIEEYRAYLKLKPDAPDRDEVDAWIRQLGAIYGVPEGQ
jgi:tetratricopeptide (TPR) repeat protein